MKKIFKKILDIILFPFTVIAVIFAGIAIVANFLFTPKLFQKLTELFPQLFSKKLFIILLLILVLIAGGIFAWQYLGGPEKKAEESKELIEEETADWETYINKEYGFEIKYPNNWAYHVNDYETQQLFCFYPGKYAGDCLGMLSVSWNTTLQQRYANMKKMFEEKYIVIDSTISINDIEGKLLNIQNTTGFSKSLFFEKNNYIYNFAMVVKHEALFEQMLSTFRFIEKEVIKDETAELISSEVEGWRTYRDEGWGIEFLYPPIIEYPFQYPAPAHQVEKKVFRYYTDETYETYKEYEGIAIHGLGLERLGCSITIHKNVNPFEKYIISLLAGYESIEKNGEIFYAGLTAASRAVDVVACEPIFNQMLSTFRFLE